MIDKLEMFIALANHQHFGRAAEECGVTQPTLSAAIKQLEEQLGVMLVWRGSRFRGLTPEGQRTLDWARRIVGDTRSLRQEMRAAKTGLSGNLRISIIPTALSLASELTTPLRNRHPNLHFTITSHSSADILSALENYEIDAGITYLENEPLGRVTSVPLFHEHYYLVTRSDQAPSQVTWAEAAAQPLCLLTRDMQNRRIVNQQMARAGTPAAPRLESNSIVVLLGHVMSGDWATILPMKAVRPFLATGEISACPITEPEVSHLVGLVAPMREPFTPVLSAVLAEARRIADV